MGERGGRGKFFCVDGPVRRRQGSWFELVGYLAGSVRGGPRDLSSNKRHVRGFGCGRSAA
jgi:hypothetical protein